MSINYHQDHFGSVYGIVTGDGRVAHSACLGFGLERVTLALLRIHGLELDEWPDDDPQSAPAVEGRRSVNALADLDPAASRPHPLHSAGTGMFAETNCYADLWIELLHGLG